MCSRLILTVALIIISKRILIISIRTQAPLFQDSTALASRRARRRMRLAWSVCVCVCWSQRLLFLSHNTLFLYIQFNVLE